MLTHCKQSANKALHSHTHQLINVLPSNFADVTAAIHRLATEQQTCALVT